ncbi:MAG TPA: RagB/SusD family nutrient uptake outer membrane protein [Chitinophagaceae bacterium]|nr:RagB/SusD family nutrient uptake outer membrane protein [Chitinophagaceae bacterium]
MKKKLIYMSPIAALMMLSSCKKERLEPVPTTSISDQSAFETPDRILNQVRGLYANLRSGQFYGGRYLVYNDIRADEFINELTNGVTGLELWAGTQNNNNAQVTGLWSQAYYLINLCNVFLDGMAAGGTTVVGDALSKNYIAEARFLRALSYYSMLQLYARPYWDGTGSKPGLIIRLTGNTSFGDYAKARSTVAEVYTQILDDLNFAESNVPLTYSDPATNTTRAHRNTVIALKTRVYLSMQKYAEVITEANKIVSASAPFSASTGVAHALQADITNVFKTPYTTTESIFSMPFNSNETPGTQNQMGYYYSKNAGNGEYSLNMSTGIAADATWTAADKRRTFLAVSGTKTYLDKKYPAGSPYTDWVPVMRYSEVLLNLAEARARSTNTVDAQAVALLNAVRNRSDATTTYTVASFPTVTELINAILKERRIEFLGEGLRSPDLLRLGLTIPAKGTVSAIPPSATNYIWPISATELLLNSLCKDN